MHHLPLLYSSMYTGLGGNHPVMGTFQLLDYHAFFNASMITNTNHLLRLIHEYLLQYTSTNHFRY